MKFAFETKLINFINIFSMYYNLIGVCPKTAPSQGYTTCNHINWIGIHGRIGDKKTTSKHVHIFLSKDHFYNLSRFRLGAWNLNVSNINIKHINRSIRFCNYCAIIKNIIMEDEEHVIFYAPNTLVVGLNILERLNLT